MAISITRTVWLYKLIGDTSTVVRAKYTEYLRIAASLTQC